MAVSLITLLTLMFAVIEGGLAVYSYHFIAEAAREGARYAMVRGSSCTSFTSACPATAAQIQSYVTGLGYPGINTAASAMTVTAIWCAPTGSTPPACSAGTNAPGQIVRVSITYKFPLQLPFLPPSVAKTLTMVTSSQMVISQ
jgi:Flp pilus assembly protein TadG